jgi:methyl-accepting chemotaxis protein
MLTQTGIRNQLRRGFLGVVAVMTVFIAALLLLLLYFDSKSNEYERISNTVYFVQSVGYTAQYMAHDTNAYALGHLEHKEEFTNIHLPRLLDSLDALNSDTEREEGISLNAEEVETVNDLERQAGELEGAVRILFDATDRRSAVADDSEQARVLQEAVDAAWENQDELGNSIDEDVTTLLSSLRERQEELEQQVEQFTNISLMTSVLLIILTIAVVYRYIDQSTNRLTAPLLNLSQAAQQVATGDLSQRVDIERGDEIGVLSKSFNTMVENLQQSIEGLVAKEYLEGVVTDYQGFVRRVADGDLTSRLKMSSKDSEAGSSSDLFALGLNLNTMVDNLNTITREVREAVSRITSASAEIQAASTQQTASTTEQDTAVTQTVATVEEIRTTVQQTAERAQAVASAAQQSVEVSRRGEQAVEATVDGMQLIRQRVENIAETILSLSERTQQIGEIINTVNRIADHSKLLALNASIEAARAGEEGRGFAVVAAEVRQLAEQSRQATARIGEILNEIQQATNTAVMVTEEGSKGAERGMELVIRAGEAIRDLAATLQEATQAAVQIAASTHQQTNGMNQLASAMQQIKQASMQTSASSRQTEQSARDLTQTSRQLDQAVARYKLEA